MSDRRDRESGQPSSPRASRAEWASVVTFWILLWLPLVAMLVRPWATVSENEQRLLAPAPTLEADWASLVQLPARLEDWYDDHLGLRTQLIRSYSLLEIRLFGSSSSDLLVVGKQDWLFFGDADSIAIYRGVARMDEAELQHWQRVLEERRDWLSQRGIAFLLVLVPDKDLVYPEYMPDRLPRVSERNLLTQLSDHLAAHSSVEVLDLRSTLDEAKQRERVYHRTDTHWNDVGAYTAYQAILARLSSRLPALAQAAPTPVRPTQRTTPGLGLASIVGLARFYPEQVLELHPSEPRARVKPEHRADYDERSRRMQPIALGVEDSSLPRAVVFRDSFANALVPYLSEHFRRVLYVWDRDVDPRVVAAERPDVVIQEIVSRFLVRRPKGIAELQAERER